MKLISNILIFIVLIISAHGMAQSEALPNDSMIAYFEKAHAEFDINGMSIIILKDDSVFLDWNKGLAQENVEVTQESVYNIASCTKAFTAAAIAQLVDQGKLNWDDKVIDYLPEFKLADPYITTHLTIEDLLTHRSGLGTFYGDLLWYETQRTRKEVIERLQYLPITNDFRSEYGYQNTMYMVAAEILEQVTGQSWGAYLSEQFFQPMGMNETRINGGALEETQQIAYPMINQEVVGITMMNTHAAASLFSSTKDLSIWAQMLLNKGIINGDTILLASVVNDMMAPRMAKKVSGLRRMSGAQFSTYALGWNVWDHNGIKVVEHAGGMPGYIAQVTLVPQEDLAIIILTNTLTGLPTALEMYILDAFLKHENNDWAQKFLSFKQRGDLREKTDSIKRVESRIPHTKPSLDLEKYVGVYEDEMYGKAQVTLDDNGKLQMVFLPTKDLFFGELKHWHYDTFQVQFADPFLPAGYISFSFDSRRNIQGFKIDLKSNDFHFFNLEFHRVE